MFPHFKVFQIWKQILKQLQNGLYYRSLVNHILANGIFTFVLLKFSKWILPVSSKIAFSS